MSLVLKNINIIDVEQQVIKQNMDIRIDNGKITQIGKVETKENDAILDGTGKFVSPGFIDAHIHFFQSSGIFTRPDVLDLRHVKSYKDEIDDVKADVEETFLRYLSCGVTGVVDCGGPFWNFEVQTLAEKINLSAPRVAVAGPLISTVSREILDLGDPPIIKTESQDHSIKMVHDCAEKHPVFVKKWFIYIPDSFDADSKLIEAAIKETKKIGLRSAVHATELETASRAVQYGADILVHSVMTEPVDDDFINLLRTHNVIYIPTLIVSQRYVESFNFKTTMNNYEQVMGDPKYFHSLRQLKNLKPEIRNAAYERIKARVSLDPTKMNVIAKDNLKKLFDAGIFIACGTDAGNIGTLHGPSLHREMEVMVEAGMDPFSVLKSATSNAAKVLGDEKVGIIKEGYLADLVILNKNPIENISNTTSIEHIIRNGQILNSEKLISPVSQSDIVDKQVEAFNNQDIDGFLATYDPEIQIFDLKTNTCLMKGLDQLRERYRSNFEKNPHLHASIKNKILQGNLVFHQEEVTGLEGNRTNQTVAIYEVINQFITRVWFGR